MLIFSELALIAGLKGKTATDFDVSILLPSFLLK